ncbi:MAG: cytochrome C oxidase subunit IV family protein [Cyclobacteriaceae bacterium]
MNFTLERTWGILVLLTIGTALIAHFFPEGTGVMVGIMALAGIKFLLVAFQFMDIKKAHGFWKASLIFYVVLIVLLNFIAG